MPPQRSTPQTSAADHSAPIDHRKKRRNRLALSCVNCHQAKRSCDRKRPCSRCVQLGITGLCVYEVDKDVVRGDSADENIRLRRRIAELESVVRGLKNNPHPRWASSGIPTEDLPRMYRKKLREQQHTRTAETKTLEDTECDKVSTCVQIGSPQPNVAICESSGRISSGEAIFIPASLQQPPPTYPTLHTQFDNMGLTHQVFSPEFPSFIPLSPSSNATPTDSPFFFQIDPWHDTDAGFFEEWPLGSHSTFTDNQWDRVATITAPFLHAESSFMNV